MLLNHWLGFCIFVGGKMHQVSCQYNTLVAHQKSLPGGQNNVEQSTMTQRIVQV